MKDKLIMAAIVLASGYIAKRNVKRQLYSIGHKYDWLMKRESNQ